MSNKFYIHTINGERGKDHFYHELKNDTWDRFFKWYEPLREWLENVPTGDYTLKPIDDGIMDAEYNRVMLTFENDHIALLFKMSCIVEEGTVVIENGNKK